MDTFPTINTKNLILRRLKNEDFENYYEYISDDKVKKQFNFNYNEEECKARLENLVKRYDEEIKPFVWGIALKTTNELVGIISVDSYSMVNKKFSLACGITEKYRGHGYAYEATYQLIDYMFENVGMHRLEIAHIIGNIASQKTIEKLGAKFEGVARESKFYIDGFEDRKIYSILKPEWEENKKDMIG